MAVYHTRVSKDFKETGTEKEKSQEQKKKIQLHPTNQRPVTKQNETVCWKDVAVYQTF